MKRKKRTDQFLVEGEDYIINNEGFWVFTEKYHLKRGFCCGNYCKNCPFEFENCTNKKK